MKLNEYQQLAMKTAIFPKNESYSYTALGLVGEAGEVANKVKKFIRDGYDEEELHEKIGEVQDELGDVLWYLAACADVLGTDLESVAKNNLWKLAERQRNNTLRGSGDKR
jgi:NTP pyrophosphatase (non-canonical NTP hydrolase)